MSVPPLLHMHEPSLKRTVMTILLVINSLREDVARELAIAALLRCRWNNWRGAKDCRRARKEKPS